jgi:hypothetical protein
MENNFFETIKQADTGCWTHVFRYDIFRVLKTHKCLVRLMISHTPPDKKSQFNYIFSGVVTTHMKFTKEILVSDSLILNDTFPLNGRTKRLLVLHHN